MDRPSTNFGSHTIPTVVVSANSAPNSGLPPTLVNTVVPSCTKLAGTPSAKQFVAIASEAFSHGSIVRRFSPLVPPNNSVITGARNAVD